MKKTIGIILFASLNVFVFSSCKKRFTCSCTYNNNVVYTADLGKQTQSDAQNICDTNVNRVPGETWICTLH